ncbi:hypothetical protein MJ699_19840 [Klebsiella pneumoniae]|nr:hypothetical protein MJ699_19840 [Klebsiella pneumoniae]
MSDVFDAKLSGKTVTSQPGVMDVAMPAGTVIYVAKPKIQRLSSYFRSNLASRKRKGAGSADRANRRDRHPHRDGSAAA